MGDSENILSPEEEAEVNRILGMLPSDSSTVFKTVPKRPPVEPEEDFSQTPEITHEAGEPSGTSEEMDFDLPVDREEGAAKPEEIEDITEMIEMVDESAMPDASAKGVLEAEPEIVDVSAVELEGQQETAISEEKLPDIADIEAIPPMEEISAPEAGGEEKKAASTLDELEEFAAIEPAEIKDTGTDQLIVEEKPASNGRSPMAEISEDEIPEIGGTDVEKPAGMKIDSGTEIEMPDLSDIKVKDAKDIPEAGALDIPEINIGDIPEITKEAELPPEITKDFHDEGIPSPVDMEHEEIKLPSSKEAKTATEARVEDDISEIPGMRDIEDIVKKEDIPEFKHISEIEPEPQIEAAPPSAKKDEGLDISDRDLKKLKTALLLFHQSIRKAVKDVILKDMLPVKEAKQLLDMILSGKSEENIHRFLEDKLKQKIEIGREIKSTGRKVISARAEYKRAGLERQKHFFKMTTVFGIAALVAFLLTITGYQYVYKPYMAKRYIKQGVALIKEPGDPVTKKMKDYNKAEEIFKYVDENYIKNYIPGYNAYARAYLYKKEFEFSLGKLESARKLDPVNIETLNNLGYFYSRVSDNYYNRTKPADSAETRLDMAIKFYKYVLNRDPRNVDALYGIGNAYLGQGQHLKARQYYEDIIKFNPKSAVGYSGVLNLYIEKDAMPEILSVHSTLVNKGILKDVPSALLSKLAAYYLGKKRTDTTNVRIDYSIQSVKYKDLSDNPYPAVRAVLDTLHARDPHYPPMYLQYAKLSKELKNYNLVENYLLKALKEEPNYFGALSMLGEYYYTIKEPVKAYKYLNDAIKASLSPPEFTTEDFYYETETVGRTYHVLGNIFYYFFDKVKYRFGDEMEEEEVGGSAEQQANFEIAKDKYELALKEKYKAPELSYNLGRIYYMKGQYEKALEQWLDLYEDFVTQPEMMFALGNAFYHLNNLEAGRGEYLKLISIFERDAEKIKTVIPSRTEHINIFQTLASAYNNLGAIYQRKNNETKSSISYWKAIDYAKKLDRENEFARVNLGRAFKTRNEQIMPVLDENIPFSIESYSITNK